MRRLGPTACACLLLPGLASAAEVAVQVEDARGRPAADAVVTVVPDGDQPRASPAAPATRFIDQRDETFIPYVEVFRPGDSVVFRNSDKTRHHAYSFAPAKAFEFVLGPGEKSSPLVLEKPGVVAVGCNIHDRMITYLFVSAAPYVAKTGSDGRAVVADLAPGAYTVRVWHPQIRPGGEGFAKSIAFDDPGQRVSVSATLALIPDPRLQSDREKARY